LVNELRKYPFLRLLFPLVIGIILADYLFFECIPLSINYLLAGLIVVFFSLFIVYFSKWHRTYGILLNLFFLLAGITLATFQLSESGYSFVNKKIAYSAIVTSSPEKKANNILCSSIVTTGYDSSSFPISKKVLLYFALDSAVQNIKRGDIILFYSQPSLPRNNGNPDEFDYPRYLQRKGISGTAYIQSGNWKHLSRSNSSSMQEIAFDFRDNLLSKYQQLGFGGDELAVLSALTVGYKDELSEEIRESFSVSGASHVLALSGLHVGLLFGLMHFAFKKLFGRGRKARILQAIITIILLWSFAFITGLSPSVVRSVCMFSLIALSQINTGRALSIHTLSVAAFFMLLYNSMWLFDVGFQLSFIAVLGIVLIQPRMNRWIEVRNPILKYFRGIITVSIAAQIATAPLVIFYFSRFSTHFLLTNLWVILLVTIIVYGAVIMIIALPIVWLSQVCADALNYLLKVLNTSVRWIEALPYSSIDNLWLHHWDVIIFYLVMLISLRFITHYKKKYIFALMGCFLLLTIHHAGLAITKNTHSNIIFYNMRNCPVVHCINNNGKSWLVHADTVPDTKRLYRTLSNYWNRKGITSHKSVITDMEDNEILRVDNLLVFKDKRIYILNDNRWNNKYNTNPLTIDYLYINKGFTGSIESLSNVFSTRCVVLDASLSFYRTALLKSECIQLGYEYVLLNERPLIIEL